MFPVNLYSSLVYPTLFIVSLTFFSISNLTLLLTSPAIIDFPVVTSVSQATLDCGSKARKLSNMESLISVSYTHLRAHET